MTDDLRKLAEALCHRLRNTPPNVLKEREAADTIDRLTAENEEHLKDKVALAMEVERQRRLLEQAGDALCNAVDAYPCMLYIDALEAITQYLQPQEGEKNV